ncbi:MAG: hypothetical protein IPK32_07640 [Verrucomicrobiaceae bacterium]|nr:hypothetical protein [Verrucomicrobiaceae bacterium]
MPFKLSAFCLVLLISPLVARADHVMLLDGVIVQRDTIEAHMSSDEGKLTIQLWWGTKIATQTVIIRYREKAEEESAKKGFGALLKALRNSEIVIFDHRQLSNEIGLTWDGMKTPSDPSDPIIKITPSPVVTPVKKVVKVMETTNTAQPKLEDFGLTEKNGRIESQTK